MRVIIPPGESVLRLTLMSAGNFGADRGTADLDRPLALDPWTGLPYIPWSAIKGVVASVARTSLPGATVFGDADQEAGEELRPGRPGALRFGDGELACVPLPLQSGRVADLLPADTLARLSRLALWHAPVAPPSSRGWGGSVTPHDLGPAAARLVPTSIVAEPHQLALLLGTPLAERWLIAGREAAARLFLEATERRTQTALTRTGKTVAVGSLRHVELVPGSAVFLSVVTNSRAEEIHLDVPARIQIGAWEASGAGFVSVAIVPPGESSPGDSSGGRRFAPIEALVATPEDQIMVAVFEAVRSAQSTAAARPLASLAKEIGPRWRLQGLPKTLAFCAASAAFDRESDLTPEAIANRRALEILFGLESGTAAAELRRRAVAVATGSAPEPAELESRVRWLRRYAEVLLPEEAP